MGIKYTFDLARATEEAAIAASQWVGTGDKLNADKAATDAMRGRLNRIDFSAKILIGEGIKDESFGLFSGEFVGGRDKNLDEEHYEIAADPIDGTRPTVTSGPEALSVIGIAEHNSMFTTEDFYMNKIAYGPEIAKKTKLSLKNSIANNIDTACQVSGKVPGQMVVCLLDRPRHTSLIEALRKTGVRIKLIQDCDISAAIATCLPDSGIDIMCGSGGAPEGILAACAMKCLGGGFEVQLAGDDGIVRDPKIFGIEDLVRGNSAFAATGITDGSLLKGVRFTNQGPVTHSVAMRSESQTVRWIKTYHGN